MTEETDALNNRIRQLENQVADMQRLVQDTSDLLDIARANGLDKFLTGHGFFETGGGLVQNNTRGIYFKQPAGNTQTAFFMLESFPAPGDSPFNHQMSEIYAVVNDTTKQSSLYLESRTESFKWAAVDVLSNATSQEILLDFDDGIFALDAYYKEDGTESYIELGGNVFVPKITARLADPSGITLHRGMLVYRDDIDRLRLYMIPDNGAPMWDSLATESYVASGAGIATGFADHFLVMGG